MDNLAAVLPGFKRMTAAVDRIMAAVEAAARTTGPVAPGGLSISDEEFGGIVPDDYALPVIAMMVGSRRWERVEAGDDSGFVLIELKGVGCKN